MTTGRITVSPMDHPTFRVPFVHPVELDGVALTELGDPWGEIDVVGNQNCLAGTQTDNETLVATAIIVIRENPSNLSLALNLKIADVVFEGAGQN